MGMTRRVNKLVDEYFHPESGMRVGIYLTPENTFVSDALLGGTIEDATAAGLKSKLLKFMDDNFTLKFVPVIVVELPETTFRNPEHTALSIKTTRLLLARNAQGKFFYADWRDKDETDVVKMKRARNYWRRGLEGEEFNLPLKIGDECIIPYTENSWSALMELHGLIKQARAKLDDMLSSKNVIDRLESAGNTLKLLAENTGD
jgi:hypothetical protein